MPRYHVPLDEFIDQHDLLDGLEGLKGAVEPPCNDEDCDQDHTYVLTGEELARKVAQILADLADGEYDDEGLAEQVVYSAERDVTVHLIAHKGECGEDEDLDSETTG